jgi:hypothetical protein
MFGLLFSLFFGVGSPFFVFVVLVVVGSGKSEPYSGVISPFLSSQLPSCIWRNSLYASCDRCEQYSSLGNHAVLTKALLMLFL